MLRSRAGLATIPRVDSPVDAAAAVLKSPASEGNGHTSASAVADSSAGPSKSRALGNGKAAERRPSLAAAGASRKRTLSGPHGHREEEPAAAWFDAPLALALVPTVGSFVTGGEHVRDFLLLLIMLFYLHQLIRVPWELYTMSRPRRQTAHPPSSSSEPRPEHVRNAELARSELHSLSLFYLALTILSPLIGAYLLRTISATLLGQDYISWFSTIVFVLAAGIRPWRHLIHLLRTRTLELQDEAHDGSAASPHADRRSLLQRVDLLEEQLAEALCANAAFNSEMSRLQQALDQSSDELEKLVRRVARKSETERNAQAQRLEVLEAKLDAIAAKRALAPAVSVPSLVPSFVGGLFNTGSSAGPAPATKPRRSAHRSRKAPKSLSRIPEDGELILEDDDEPEELEWYERLMQVAFAPVRTLRLLFLFIVQMVRSVFFS